MQRPRIVVRMAKALQPGTASVVDIAFAVRDPLLQFVAMRGEFRDAMFDRCQPLGHEGARRRAGAAGAQVQQPVDLVQCEAHRLCAADEAQPIDVVVVVAAGLAVAARRLGQQSAALVVAHRFDVDLGQRREASDRDEGWPLTRKNSDNPR